MFFLLWPRVERRKGFRKEEGRRRKRKKKRGTTNAPTMLQFANPRFSTRAILSACWCCWRWQRRRRRRRTTTTTTTTTTRQRITNNKKRWVGGKKPNFPEAILSSRGDKKKQFKYLCYQNRTRWIQDILIQILCDCVDKKELENNSFDYLIGNEDVAKDVLAFIEMLQLRLNFQIKVKLLNLNNTDSFRVHNKENKNKTLFDQKALDEFSKTLYMECPIGKQRRIISALKTAVPEF